jgi:hypothetical protein
VAVGGSARCGMMLSSGTEHDGDGDARHSRAGVDRGDSEMQRQRCSCVRHGEANKE